MRKTWLKVVLAICIIVMIIVAVRLLRGTDKGTPNQEQKGNPLNN